MPFFTGIIQGNMTQKLQKTADNQEIPVQVFNPYAASKKYHYTFFAPSLELKGTVDSHWSMHWDLTDDAPFKLELASSPFIAFTFTQYGDFVTGIHTGVYSYTISGKGSLYGTLFKPTRFYELYQQSLSELTNKELSVASLFPVFGEGFGKRLLDENNDTDVIKIIENAVKSIKKSSNTKSSELVDKIMDYSISNPEDSITAITKQFGLSERTLHQLFHDTVGVGIKWVTTRDRLQKAMYIAAKSDAKPNWTSVALELGYSDQSHFINDFKKIIGMSPSRYHKLLARTK